MQDDDIPLSRTATGAVRESFSSDPSRESSPRWEPFLVLFLAALLFVPALGKRDLWNPDEARYAQVAREMVEASSPFVPYLNGKVYSEKPPLLFWLAGGIGRLRGTVDELAARLPLALSAIFSVLLVFLLGRKIFGRRAGWIAAIAYATCAAILWQGRFGQIDMLLGFLVLAGTAVWLWGDVDDRPRLKLLFFVFTGLAILAKGPAGLLPPLLAIVVFHVVRKEWQRLRELRIGWGLLVVLAFVAAWLLPATLQAGPEYLRTMVFKQNVTRYARSWGHLNPWYFYLQILPGTFFPWSLVLPAALVAGWRHLRGETRRVFLFALTWVAVTLVFFSLSPGKRSVYILTMYPALALLVGAGLDAWSRDTSRLRAGLGWPLLVPGILLGGVALYLPRVAEKHPEVAPLGADFPRALALVLLGLGAALCVGSLGAFRGRLRVLVGALGAGMAAVALVLFVGLVPRVDRLKSARPLAAAFHEQAGPDEPYLIYPRIDPAVLYYVGRPAELADGERELRDFVRGPGTRWVMIERDDFEKLESPLGLDEVYRDRDLREGYLLLRKQEARRGPHAERRRRAGRRRKARSMEAARRGAENAFAPANAPPEEASENGGDTPND